jgi:hypothetical protein
MAEHKESPFKNKNAVTENSVENKSNFQLKDNRAAAVLQQKQVEGLQQLPIQKKANTIQLADDGEPGRSFRNLIHYSVNTVTEYGEARIMQALTTHGLTIRGHHSGSGGSGMNAATTQDIAALVRVLRAETPEVEEDEVKEKGGKGKGGQRHSKAEEAEHAAEKAKQKDAKKAAKKDFFNANQRGGRGGGRGGGADGRGGGRGGIRV